MKFIFATTEVHKVPVTILSRCQRYDFKLIGAPMIATRIREVLAQESIVADDASVATLSREAAGSMRDAMSLLDQVVAYGGDTLRGEDVARVLGVADRSVMHDLGAAILGGDATGALDIARAIAEQGFDVVHVAKDFLHHLRDLVVAKACQASPGEERARLLALPEEEERAIVDVAARHELDDVLRVYQGFSRSFDEIAKSAQPRHALEMTFVRLARRPPLLPLDELLSRLGDLERRLSGGAPPPGPGRGGGGGGAARSGGPGRGPSPGPASVSPISKARAEGSFETRGTSAIAAAPRAVVPEVPRSDTLPASVPPPVPPPAPLLLPAPEVLAAWRSIVEAIHHESHQYASVYEHGAPLAVAPDGLVIGFVPGSFPAEQAKQPEVLRLVARAAARHFGVGDVPITLDTTGARSVATLSAMAEDARLAASAAARKAVADHALVRLAISLFDGELRDVKIPED